MPPVPFLTAGRKFVRSDRFKPFLSENFTDTAAGGLCALPMGPSEMEVRW